MRSPFVRRAQLTLFPMLFQDPQRCGSQHGTIIPFGKGEDTPFGTRAEAGTCSNHFPLVFVFIRTQSFDCITESGQQSPVSSELGLCIYQPQGALIFSAIRLLFVGSAPSEAHPIYVLSVWHTERTGRKHSHGILRDFYLWFTHLHSRDVGQEPLPRI
ncbi:hypothetical protein CC79DRAFT_788747 [Sarocladium strictum]